MSEWIERANKRREFRQSGVPDKRPSIKKKAGQKPWRIVATPKVGYSGGNLMWVIRDGEISKHAEESHAKQKLEHLLDGKDLLYSPHGYTFEIKYVSGGKKSKDDDSNRV